MCNQDLALDPADVIDFSPTPGHTRPPRAALSPFEILFRTAEHTAQARTVREELIGKGTEAWMN